jgi:TetR/AcrR family transcriptional repressor of mexJK operon
MARRQTTHESSTRPVGRPRDHEKRAAIIDAGWKTFLQDGFSGASLDAIARKAGVSRVTLYSHFPNKEALFRAAIEREMERLSQSQLPLQPDVTLRDGLVAFGAGIMGYLTSDDVISFYSVLAGDLRRHPDLAKSFYALGPGVTHRNLSAIIADAQTRGELAVSDPQEAAEHLIGLWQGLSNYKLSLGVGTEALLANLDRHIASAVDLFLVGYAACPSKA